MSTRPTTLCPKLPHWHPKFKGSLPTYTTWALRRPCPRTQFTIYKLFSYTPSLTVSLTHTNYTLRILTSTAGSPGFRSSLPYGPLLARALTVCTLSSNLHAYIHNQTRRHAHNICRSPTSLRHTQIPITHTHAKTDTLRMRNTHSPVKTPTPSSSKHRPPTTYVTWKQLPTLTFTPAHFHTCALKHHATH
jgi:hypothetical protein